MEEDRDTLKYWKQRAESSEMALRTVSGLIRKIEWSGPVMYLYGTCPACRGEHPNVGNGHKRKCWLNQLLKTVGEDK